MEISKVVEQTLKELGVATLYLFGSRVQGIERKDSDYDFGLLLENPSILIKGTEVLYQKIYDLLQDWVEEKVNIDIVFLDQATVQLRYQVISYGKVLYDGHPVKRGRFIERTLTEHADFEPYRRIFEEAILTRIS
ncbi:MAG: nucleotidyltransferase domain-containing protein [Chlamydiae bacterium]|nr:nucleotidyltransferase domain-containing protein [Chlamydiota bacterium]MBI3277522.1 nucleotidyltransferase domain-containing protein [Chlamydiota bacterium]